MKSEAMPVFVYNTFAADNHKPPRIYTEMNKPWIFFGEDNAYPQYLLDLLNMSAKHNAIVNGKVDRILGKGWSVDTTGLEPKEIALQTFFLNNANRGEDLNEFTRKITMDWKTHNGISFQPIYDLSGRLRELVHVDWSKIRKGKEGSEFEGKFIYSDNWEDPMGRPLDPKWNPRILDPYNPKRPWGQQLFYFEGYRPGMQDYPLPQYVGATAAIETDIEISNWHLNNIKHGFSGGYIINFNNGIPSNDEKKKLEKQIIKKHTGSDAAGRFVLNFADSKENSAEVIPITPNNLDKQFDQLSNQTTQAIFTGHSVTSPMMFGIKTQGQLGGRTELIDSEELFENTVTRMDRMIIEKVINKLLQDQGIDAQLTLQPAQTISFQFGEATIAGVMTTDELRLQADNMGIELQEPEIGEEGEEIDTGQNEVAEALSVLSPLIATKVLETMSEEEVRALVGLTARVDVPLTPADFKKLEAFVAIKEEEMLLEELIKRGRPADQYKTLKVNPEPASFRNQTEMVLSEERFKKQYFQPALTISVTTLDRKILDLLIKDPLLPMDQIADIVGVGENIVAKEINRLSRGGALRIGEITNEEGGTIPERTVTEAGQEAVEIPEVPIAQVEVLYRYVEAPGIPPAKSGSRTFCRNLIAANLLWSREDIQAMSNPSNKVSNVWARRGGFYTNPETGITTPYCRHIWQQEIVTSIS